MRKSAATRAAELPTGDGAGGDAGGAPNGRAPVRGGGEHPLQAFAAEELVEDFRLACISRALDDREIALQKQSRVFFQISGAGHEVLLTRPRALAAPVYDWFFPYYRDRALSWPSASPPTRCCSRRWDRSEDPASGGRQMPCHWGDAGCNIVTQSSPTGSQCLPAVGCAEAGRFIAPRAGLRGCERPSATRSPTSRSARGPTSEGEFWESLNTACRLHLPVLYLVADNGYAISVPPTDQSPAPISELGARLSAASP